MRGVCCRAERMLCYYQWFIEFRLIVAVIAMLNSEYVVDNFERESG